MNQFVLFAFISCASAFRNRHRSRSWSTTADRDHGPCAPYLGRGVSAVIGGKDNLPVNMPLKCTGEATQVELSATAYGHTSALLRVQLDGQQIGENRYPWWQPGQDKTLTLTVGTLSSGLHFVRFYGEKIDFKSVTLIGNGGSCSFDEAAGWDESISGDTSTALDALNRLYGPSQNFATSAKKQLYFASETVGTTDDGEIASTVVADGIWKWMVSYSQNSSSRDAWGNNPDGLWTEAKTYPHQEISLEYVPGRTGQKMLVIESCNTLSNIAFHEVAVWASCKAWPFTRAEVASIVSAFNGLAAGSSFLHACGCSTGGRTDTFTMDWLLLQSYQLMVQKAVEGAGEQLTEAEKNAVLSFARDGEQAVMALDVAVDMTRLFRTKYDRDLWTEVMDGYQIPRYMTGICGVISYTLFALNTNSAIPGVLGPIFDQVLELLLEAFFPNQEERDWLINTYYTAAKKALDNVVFCPDPDGSWIDPLVISFTKFCVTFIEALVYQEQTLPELPAALQSLLDFLESVGITSEGLMGMERTWDIYNGHDCHSQSDHAIWHYRAGHGLLHLVDMAELLYSRTKASADQC